MESDLHDLICQCEKKQYRLLSSILTLRLDSDSVKSYLHGYHSFLSLIVDFKSPSTRQWIQKYSALLSVVLIHNITDVCAWIRFLQWICHSAIYYESIRVESTYNNSKISTFFDTVGYTRDPLMGCPKSKEGSSFASTNIITCIQYLQKVFPNQILATYQGTNTTAGRENQVTVEEGVIVLFYSFLMKTLVLEYVCSPLSKAEVELYEMVD